MPPKKTKNSQKPSVAKSVIYDPAQSKSKRTPPKPNLKTRLLPLRQRKRPYDPLDEQFVKEFMDSPANSMATVSKRMKIGSPTNRLSRQSSQNNEKEEISNDNNDHLNDRNSNIDVDSVRSQLSSSNNQPMKAKKPKNSASTDINAYINYSGTENQLVHASSNENSVESLKEKILDISSINHQSTDDVFTDNITNIKSTSNPKPKLNKSKSSPIRKGKEKGKPSKRTIATRKKPKSTARQNKPNNTDGGKSNQESLVEDINLDENDELVRSSTPNTRSKSKSMVTVQENTSQPITVATKASKKQSKAKKNIAEKDKDNAQLSQEQEIRKLYSENMKLHKQLLEMEYKQKTIELEHERKQSYIKQGYDKQIEQLTKQYQKKEKATEKAMEKLKKEINKYKQDKDETQRAMKSTKHKDRELAKEIQILKEQIQRHQVNGKESLAMLDKSIHVHNDDKQVLPSMDHPLVIENKTSTTPKETKANNSLQKQIMMQQMMTGLKIEQIKLDEDNNTIYECVQGCSHGEFYFNLTIEREETETIYYEPYKITSGKGKNIHSNLPHYLQEDIAFHYTQLTLFFHRLFNALNSSLPSSSSACSTSSDTYYF